MPTPEERFLWVDLTYPIRAIYIPSTFHAYPQRKYAQWTQYVGLKFIHNSLTLKAYTRVDFFRRQPEQQTYAQNAHVAARYGDVPPPPPQQVTVTEPDVPEEPYSKEWVPEYTVEEVEIKQGAELGLGFQPKWTARFDLRELAMVLHVPSELREEKYLDTYQFIPLFRGGDVDSIETWQAPKTARIVELGNSEYTMLADVIKVQEGTSMKGKPTKGDVDWLKESVKDLIGIGLGLIPYIGPFLSMGYDAAMDYLDDPAAWGAKNELKLGTQANARAIKSGFHILKFYRKGKVPRISFKSHLEGDERQPMYVGEDGQEGEGAQQEPSTEQEEEAGHWENPDEMY